MSDSESSIESGVIEGSGAILHGGNLDEAQALFPQAEKPWLDLSTGINPVAYPIPAIPDEALRRLPAPAAAGGLERIAAEAYGATDPAGVVAASGTQALIELLPRLRPPGRVAVLGPTYAEHGLAWRKAGHTVEEVSSLDRTAQADVAVLVNPNNPDGRVTSRSGLVALAKELARHRGWLVVDEAFADLEDMDSLIPSLPANAIVLRSFGKTYGLAGLRLGFAVAHPTRAAQIRSALGPWAVSGPAIAIGQRALSDAAWRTAAAAARKEDAARLDSLMTGVASLAGGTRLFRLYESSAAPRVFEHLGQRGIWVRRFREHRAWLRLGLPGSETEWQRLAAALHTFPRSGA